MQEVLSIGKILNFHGIKGEVKVGYTEGDEKIFTEIKKILVVKDSKQKMLTVEQVRFHKKFALIKFKEINSIDEVMEYKGALLKAPKELLNNYLEDNEFYIKDLVGLKVYDNENNILGEISGVVNIKGQDTLFIKDQNNKEHMVPFNKNFVPEINMEQKFILINKIEGLLG